MGAHCDREEGANISRKKRSSQRKAAKGAHQQQVLESDIARISDAQRLGTENCAGSTRAILRAAAHKSVEAAAAEAADTGPELTFQWKYNGSPLTGIDYKGFGWRNSGGLWRTM